MSSKITNFDQVNLSFPRLSSNCLVGIKEYSEWPTIPQLYVNGEFVGGCDIVMNMHKSGELEKVLDDAGVLVSFDEAEETASTEGSEIDAGKIVIEEIGVDGEKGGKKHDVKKVR
jgi:hypothetical protein